MAKEKACQSLDNGKKPEKARKKTYLDNDKIQPTLRQRKKLQKP
jgi:hypothetical protein